MVLEAGEYENCQFSHCHLEGQNLSEFSFVDCSFTDCNLSLVKLNKTSFENVQFIACKMLGTRFDTCKSFGLSFSFKHCMVNHASFYKMKLNMGLSGLLDKYDIEIS
jgi:uncharacterized protein YjbI with pentapeptide repeats